MKTQSLIPSFEPDDLHSVSIAANDITTKIFDDLQEIKNLANPLLCDEKYLPFLAYAFKVDFNNRFVRASDTGEPTTCQ